MSAALTVGKLQKFIGAFPVNTPVVVGMGSTPVYPCKVNTYYPPDKPITVEIVLDPISESVNEIDAEHY